MPKEKKTKNLISEDGVESIMNATVEEGAGQTNLTVSATKARKPRAKKVYDDSAMIEGKQTTPKKEKSLEDPIYEQRIDQLTNKEVKKCVKAFFKKYAAEIKKDPAVGQVLLNAANRFVVECSVNSNINMSLNDILRMNLCVSSRLKSKVLCGMQPMQSTVGSVLRMVSKNGNLGASTKVCSEVVSARSVSLKNLTMETMQDMQAVFNSEYQSVENATVAELADKIDREVISRLIEFASNNSSVQISSLDQDDYYVPEMILAFNETTTTISKGTKRGAPTWALVATDVAERITNSSDAFGILGVDVIDGANTSSTCSEIAKIGVMKIYASNLMPSGKALVGHKGSEIDTGFVVAPYILAWPTLLCLGGQPLISVLTWFGDNTSLVENSELGKQQIENISKYYVMVDFKSTHTEEVAQKNVFAKISKYVKSLFSKIKET